MVRDLGSSMSRRPIKLLLSNVAPFTQRIINAQTNSLLSPMLGSFMCLYRNAYATRMRLESGQILPCIAPRNAVEQVQATDTMLELVEKGAGEAKSMLHLSTGLSQDLQGARGLAPHGRLMEALVRAASTPQRVCRDTLCCI